MRGFTAGSLELWYVAAATWSCFPAAGAALCAHHSPVLRCLGGLGLAGIGLLAPSTSSWWLARSSATSVLPRELGEELLASSASR